MCGFIFKIQLSEAIKNGIAKPREDNKAERETPKLPTSFPGLLAFELPLFPGGLCISHGTALIGLKKSRPMMVKIL